MIDASEISQLIKSRIKGFEKEIDIKEVGTVLSVGDGIALIYGLEKAWPESWLNSRVISSGWFSTLRRRMSV